MTNKNKQFARLWLTDYQVIFKLSPAERAVYLALTLYGSKDAKVDSNKIVRHCYPSQNKMADLLGCSTGTIRRGVSRLKLRAQNGRYLAKKDKDGKEYIQPEDLHLPRMLVVKHRMSTSSVYILSSHVELIDSSHVESIDISHIDMQISSHVELKDSSHDEREIKKEKKDTINKVIEDLEPLDLKFQLIFNYFSRHSLTQWKGPRELEEFKLIKNRSTLNVGMELLHIGAYQLQKIDEYDKETNNRRFWTRRFWISGMSQWLGRKRKSVLDMKRSLYIEKLKTLIPDLEPKPQSIPKIPVDISDHNVVLKSNQTIKTEGEELVLDLLERAKEGNKTWITTLEQFSGCNEFPEHMRTRVNILLNKFKKD